MYITVECSPEQEDIIVDHQLYSQELGILPDEKQWILNKVQKKYPHCKIKKVELDLFNVEWKLEIEL